MPAPIVHNHFDLKAAARLVMEQNGFEPDFPAEVEQQLAHLPDAATIQASGEIRDLRNLLWSSIDNDTSRDLDQIEYVERGPDQGFKVMVGIADVDAFSGKNSPIDSHAAKETTTIYTGVEVFPMLPEQLSTGLTSLLPQEDRLCVVIEYTVSADGHLGTMNVYRALVRNKAQLTYSAVGAWLDDGGNAPPQVAASHDLETQLKMQNQIAQILKAERFRHGALTIESTETTPVMLNGEVVGVSAEQKNSASELIEEFMIAANEVVARTLRAKGVSSIRRIVKTPERWGRIVEVAAKYGVTLPAEPDSGALNEFLVKQKAADPDHFPDLSIGIVKLMGPGEYELETPNSEPTGHFGLAVQDYTHSTAPNRRFADLVTQRILKALITGQPGPYSDDELRSIAQNCTVKGNAARKVEREMSKRIAAVAMSSKIGHTYDAIVTGVTPHGTFVRILNPRVDGLLQNAQQGIDVGDRLSVRLVRTDVQRGYIDFEMVSKES